MQMEVQILVEGYAFPNSDGSYSASPTTSLIKVEQQLFLVDPGTNEVELLMALRRLNLRPEDIHNIYLSHYHPDHFLNIRLFPDADLYDGAILWQGDKEFFHKGYIPGTEIEILPTPGHSPEHTSLLVQTAEGVVCIAQDVFWWEDGQQRSDTVEELLSVVDPFVTDKTALTKSRQLILEKADWIIPGHGKKFRNPARVT